MRGLGELGWKHRDINCWAGGIPCCISVPVNLPLKGQGKNVVDSDFQFHPLGYAGYDVPCGPGYNIFKRF